MLTSAQVQIPAIETELVDIPATELQVPGGWRHEAWPKLRLHKLIESIPAGGGER
jgi:hypothetical protein